MKERNIFINIINIVIYKWKIYWSSKSEITPQKMKTEKYSNNLPSRQYVYVDTVICNMHMFVNVFLSFSLFYSFIRTRRSNIYY